ATSVPAYYADARYEVLPYDELARVVTYARHRRVDFIVADRAEIPSFRPGLTSLLIPARAHPGLELVKSLREGTRHAIYIYRVLPEAVESARR
ncbi:MAG TPA: hypothetical protein VFP98_02480, partial [Candidatus Polarisedimenticolia bacterium]|nr:hypothetical protein [Candidatus Polarisedimenticolia bacterium]